MGPNTELNVVITDASGVTKTLDSNASDPADRPRGIQFGTQLMSGFFDGSFDLRRAIDRDNIDINKLDDVKFIGVNGETAYEGYVGTLPRSMDEQGHGLSVTTAGWIAHAADEPFTEIFVDRDLSQWGPSSRSRKASNIGSGRVCIDPSTAPDSISGLAALVLALTEPCPAAGMFCEALYDAGIGPTVALIYYDYVLTNTNIADVNYLLNVGVMDTDALGGIIATSNLAGTAAAANYFVPTSAKRYGYLSFDYQAALAGSAQHLASLRALAVYGNHGLTLVPGVTAPDPKCVQASDVITYLANRYAPLLDTSGVKQTTYPISHLVFRESTKPYDAFLLVNNYHLWKLGVWEKRRLCFDPIDLTDWDWEIRHDEMANTIGLQGDSAEDLRNGIKVQFTNAATGAVELLTPDVYPELQDTSVDNPANKHGRRMYGDPYVIPFPTTTDDALQLGRAKLALDTQAKAPGSFTAQHFVRDRAGNLQPAWKVRAGERIRLTSTANLSDRPRLIHETRYNHDTRSVTISVDATAQVLEAIIDRQQNAREADGLS